MQQLKHALLSPPADNTYVGQFTVHKKLNQTVNYSWIKLKITNYWQSLLNWIDVCDTVQ